MTSFYGSYSSIGSLFFFTFVFGIPSSHLKNSILLGAIKNNYNPLEHSIYIFKFSLRKSISSASSNKSISKNHDITSVIAMLCDLVIISLDL